MNTHRIDRVSKLTGLSKDVIRIWERRYGFIQPSRGENRYRIYTDEDVALLRFLKKEMEKGAPIGDLATLGREALIEQMQAIPEVEPEAMPSYDALVDRLVEHLDPLEPLQFERRLNGAVAVVPFEEALYRILIPLQERVGGLWHAGKISVAVEHYVTKHVQQKIFSAMNHFNIRTEGKNIVVACAPLEEHEIAAQIGAYLCRRQGHRVHFLGANVPLDALVALCQAVQPDLTLISMIIDPPEENLSETIEAYSKSILAICPIWIGGQAAQTAKARLQKKGLEVLDTNKEMEHRLLQHFSQSSEAVRQGQEKSGIVRR